MAPDPEPEFIARLSANRARNALVREEFEHHRTVFANFARKDPSEIDDDTVSRYMYRRACMSHAAYRVMHGRS